MDWIEGAKGGSNTGDAATDGEPNWNSRSLNVTPWTQPGGTLDGTDFASAVSGSIAVNAPGDYLINTSTALVADVQSWVCQPGSNYGWVLVSNLEDRSGTARRSGSRESAAAQIPMLTIGYSQPSPEIRISEVRLNEGQLELRWSGSAASYQIQQRTSLSADWVDVGGPVGCERNARLPAQEIAAFLRVVSR